MRNEVRSMHLGAFLFNLGNHVAAWRHPDTAPAALMNLRFYAHLAQVAERGCFDFVFHSDGVGINDTYPEIIGLTNGDQGGEGEGMNPLPQEKVMTPQQFKRMSKSLFKQGDRQPARDAVRLMIYFNLSLQQLANVGEKGLVDLTERYLAEHLAQDVPTQMFNPRRFARRVRFALSRAFIQFPNAGLPFVEPPEDLCLHPTPSKDQPQCLRNEVEGWTPRLIGQPPGTGMGKPLKESTVLEYRNGAGQLVTICRNAGLDLNHPLISL